MVQHPSDPVDVVDVGARGDRDIEFNECVHCFRGDLDDGDFGNMFLTAAQAGNANYNAASSVAQSFSISSTGRTGFTGNSSSISGTTTGTKYVVERFTTTGTSSWTVPQGVSAVDVLVVGGGGGGGSRHRGGGGGGGYVEASSYAVMAGNIYAVVVGAGGSGGSASAASDGSAGDLSSFTRSGVGLTANGGTGGGFPLAGNSGSGSGTGGTAYQNNGASGTANNGCGSGDWCGGGGGGAGSAGTNAGGLTSGTGGAGGSGRSSSISGTAITYAGGGGGGGGSSGGSSGSPSPTHTAGGSGGSGGGGGGGTAEGSGSCTPTAGTPGTNGLGGGGGGSGYCDWGTALQGAGGAGGSGIVIVRYALPSVSAPDLAAASDNGSSDTDNLTSNTTLTMTGSAPVGAVVQLSTAAQGTSPSSGTWTNTGSTCTASSTTGEWSCTTASLPAGKFSVRAVATTYLDGVTDSQTSSTALAVNIAGSATKLSISTQPVGATAGAVLATQPVVRVLDTNDLLVESSTVAISATASAGTLGAPPP